MKLSTIQMLLNKVLDIEYFKSTIENEVTEYKKLLKKKGSSNPISLTEDTDFVFTKENFRYLCELYLNNKLDDYEVSYISDSLTLSLHVMFQNEKIFDSIEALCIDETNNKLSKDFILQMLDNLSDW